MDVHPGEIPGLQFYEPTDFYHVDGDRVLLVAAVRRALFTTVEAVGVHAIRTRVLHEAAVLREVVGGREGAMFCFHRGVQAVRNEAGGWTTFADIKVVFAVGGEAVEAAASSPAGVRGVRGVGTVETAIPAEIPDDMTLEEAYAAWAAAEVMSS